MTLSTTTSRVPAYPGTGSTGPFAVPFRFRDESHLQVVRRSAIGIDTVLTLGTHYTTTGAGAASGTVTLVSALAVDESLYIRRKPPLTQPTSIRNQGAYFPGTIEDEFDLLVMQMQSMQDEIDRSVKMGEAFPGSQALTSLTPTAGKVVTGTGTGFDMTALDGGAVSLPGAGRTVSTLSAYLLNNAVRNVKDFGAVGNGVADDTVPSQAALAAGGLVWFPEPSAYYRTTDHLYTDVAGTHVYGDGAGTEIRQATTNKTCFYVRASQVTIRDLKLTGGTTELTSPDWSNDLNGAVVRVWATNLAGMLSDFVLENLTISNGNYGIDFRWCQRIKVRDCHIFHVCYAGISANSSFDGEISGCRVDDVVGDPGVSTDAYGITVGRSASESLALMPRSTRWDIHHNYVSNVPLWTGLDSHCGENLNFHHNRVSRCAWGIKIVTDSAGNANSAGSPHRIRVEDNIVELGGIATAYAGILLSGDGNSIVGDINAIDCTVIGNLVRGWVLAGGGGDSAGNIRVQNTIRMVVRDNIILESKSAAIVISEVATDIDVAGNTIRGLTADGTTAAIKVTSAAGAGTVTGAIRDNDIKDIGAETGILMTGGTAQPALRVYGNRIATTGTRISTLALVDVREEVDKLGLTRGEFSVVVLNATATTLIDLSTVLDAQTAGLYLVHDTAGGAFGCALVAVVRDGGGNYNVAEILEATAHYVFSISGTNLQLTQTLGSTRTIVGRALRFV